MAVVTATNRIDNVNGTLLEVYSTITIANTGDYWIPGLRAIVGVTFNDGAITKAAPDTSSPPHVVFTTTGAVTNALVKVVGYP